MRHDKKSILRLFEEREQYLIPLFQRGYVWNLTQQIQPLWEDLMDRLDALCEFKVNTKNVGGTDKLRPMRKHFLGTVVIGGRKGGGHSTIAAREVIDGQQRITTLQILLLAFRDVIKPMKNEALDHDLKQLTHNIGQYTDPGHHLKVWPTNAGRDVMRSLVGLALEENPFVSACRMFPVKGEKRATFERPLMVQAYLFFYVLLDAHLRGIRFDAPHQALPSDTTEEPTTADRVLRSIRKDNLVWTPTTESALDLDPERAHLFKELLDVGFQIMWLELEDEDDPQIIFETLNARGAPLQPSDLIRNFLFLQATRKGENVDALYDTHWRSFDEKPNQAGKNDGERFWRQTVRQGRLTSVRLDLLLYHYVGLRKCTDLKVAHVFNEFKDWWESAPESAARNTEVELKRLTHLANYFEAFLVSNQTTRLGIFCRRMRLLDISTLTPLVFYFLEHHGAESPEMAHILGDLESYVVRRFVCGLTTKSYNRIFTNRLLAELAKDKLTDAAALRHKLTRLTGDSQLWPSDALFEQNWRARGLYQGKNTSKVRAILEALELNKRTSKQELVSLPDGLTVEHVMPQKWEAHWAIADTSAVALENRRRSLHSIGNLTLVTSAFNSALSNETFDKKRSAIAQTSLLMLNAYFQDAAKLDSWDEEKIDARALELFPVAKAIWSRP